MPDRAPVLFWSSHLEKAWLRDRLTRSFIKAYHVVTGASRSTVKVEHSLGVAAWRLPSTLQDRGFKSPQRLASSLALSTLVAPSPSTGSFVNLTNHLGSESVPFVPPYLPARRYWAEIWQPHASSGCHAPSSPCRLSMYKSLQSFLDWVATVASPVGSDVPMGAHYQNEAVSPRRMRSKTQVNAGLDTCVITLYHSWPMRSEALSPLSLMV